METKELKVKFKMTYTDVISHSSEIRNCMSRDAAEFALFNVTPADIDNFKSMNTAFQDFPTDIELLGSVMVATEDKTLAQETLKTAIRNVMAIAVAFYKKGNVKLNRFGTKKMNDLTDAALTRLGKRVYRVISIPAIKTDLSTTGLTDAIAEDLLAKAEATDDAYFEQQMAIADREEHSHQRVTLANALYDQMIAYADLGKAIWMEKSEALYNDYVVYDSVVTKSEEKQ